MQSKNKNGFSESSTTTEQPWVFIIADSPQWRAWKRLEAPGGKRWAFRYRDPQGGGIGCDVPSEWPPGYIPTEREFAWRPPIVDRSTTGGISDYLVDGGPVPSISHPHLGRFEEKNPGVEGRKVMPKRAEMSKSELDGLEWWRMATHTCWAGKIPCTPWLRAYLDAMARENQTGDAT